MAPNGVNLGNGPVDTQNMIHVAQIREFVAAGRLDEAQGALDRLLALGPKNIEALKLLAAVFEAQGRLDQERQVWNRIVSLDREDQDAIHYYLDCQLEDREHFYFSEELPGGGRRFLAYPRALVRTSALGLLGCVTFLLITRLAHKNPALGEPAFLLSVFSVLIMVPWLYLIYCYFKSIRYISIGRVGFEIAMRFRKIHLPWSAISRLAIAHDPLGKGPSLSLVVCPQDKDAPMLEVDLTRDSSALRARGHVLREAARWFDAVEYASRNNIVPDDRRVLSF